MSDKENIKKVIVDIFSMVYEPLFIKYVIREIWKY